MSDIPPTSPLSPEDLQPAPLPSPPPLPPATVGGLRELLLFVLAAIFLFLVVQSVAVGALMYQAQQEQPHLDPMTLARQVAERTQYNAFFLVPVQLVWYALLMGVLYLLVRRRRGLTFRSGLALHSVRPNRILLLLLAGFTLSMAVNLANLLAPPPEDIPIERLFSSRGAALLVLGMALLVAPWVEELIFRGYLYGIVQGRWGKRTAVVSTGLLFGAIHFPQLWPGYAQMALLCVVGLSFSLVRARTGSTLAAAVTHLGYNATLSVGYLFSPEFTQLTVFLLR